RQKWDEQQHRSNATTKGRNHSIVFVLPCCGRHRVHHFSAVKESGLSDGRCRNRLITIARPTAASAAATVITKKTMICPSLDPRGRPNATNVRFTAFSMISI